MVLAGEVTDLATTATRNSESRATTAAFSTALNVTVATPKTYQSTDKTTTSTTSNTTPRIAESSTVTTTYYARAGINTMAPTHGITIINDRTTQPFEPTGSTHRDQYQSQVTTTTEIRTPTSNSSDEINSRIPESIIGPISENMASSTAMDLNGTSTPTQEYGKLVIRYMHLKSNSLLLSTDYNCLCTVRLYFGNSNRRGLWGTVPSWYRLTTIYSTPRSRCSSTIVKKDVPEILQESRSGDASDLDITDIDKLEWYAYLSCKRFSYSSNKVALWGKWLLAKCFYTINFNSRPHHHIQRSVPLWEFNLIRDNMAIRGKGRKESKRHVPDIYLQKILQRCYAHYYAGPYYVR